MKRFFQISKEAASEFFADDAMSLAAALALYTVIALAPLVTVMPAWHRETLCRAAERGKHLHDSRHCARRGSHRRRRGSRGLSLRDQRSAECPRDRTRLPRGAFCSVGNDRRTSGGRAFDWSSRTGSGVGPALLREQTATLRLCKLSSNLCGRSRRRVRIFSGGEGAEAPALHRTINPPIYVSLDYPSPCTLAWPTSFRPNVFIAPSKSA